MRNEIPVVFETVDGNERGYDIYSRLLKDRVVFVSGIIDDDLANAVVAQLLFLNSQDSDVKISMYINSPGGSIHAGLAIYDTMQFIDAEIHTICVGMAMSMASLLLAAGKKRFALPNSTVMIHQGSAGFDGKVEDIRIQQKEIDRLERACNDILSLHTGHSIKKLIKDQQNDKFMSSKQALEYGLIDKILERKK